MRKSKSLLCTLPSLAITLTTFSTSAQETANSPGVTLGEIVVTAQKRAENLQEIPKQVQVVSDSQLENANVTSLVDLIKLVPSMTGPNSAGMGGLISMRGVGTAAPSVGAAQKVGIVIDDVPVPSRARSAANLLDIQQVEVRPGPQGTLAGRNATGGLVNLVTRRPSQTDLVGDFEASATTDADYVVGGYLSAPINDQLAWSLSTNYQNQRGLAFNIYLGKWDIATENLGFRGKLLWALNEDAEVTLAYAHSQEINEGGGVGGWSPVYRQIDVPLNTITSALECLGLSGPNPAPGAPNPSCVVPAGQAKQTFTQLLPGITPSPDNVNYYSISRQRQERRNDTVSLRYEQAFSAGDFTFIGSYLFEDYPSVQDWLNYPNVNLDLRPEFDGYAHLGNSSEQKTLEARFASRTDQPWTYLIGVFWSDLVNDFEYQRYQQPFWGRRVFGSGSEAVFGSTSYEFVTGTTIRAGLRYESDDIDYTWAYLDIPATQRRLANGVVRNYPRVWYPTTAGNASDDYMNYDFGLEQKLDNGMMFYASYAYANQGPIYDSEDIVGSQTTVPGNPNVGVGLQPLPAEEVTSIEAGFKSTWFEDRLTFNLNFFDMKFENYQALTNVTDTANPFAQPILKTWPAGKVSSKGIELTSSALVGDHTRFDIAGMYNEAVIDEWFNAPCFANQTVQEGCIMGRIPPGEFVVRNYQADISGNMLAFAPLYKVTATGSYSNTLGFAPEWEYNASLTARYNSKQIGDQLGNPATRLDAVTFWDANLTLTNGKFQFSVFGVNLFEEFTEAFGTGLGAGLSSSLGGASTGRQPDGSYPIKTRTLDRSNVRYFGARVKYSF